MRETNGRSRKRNNNNSNNNKKHKYIQLKSAGFEPTLKRR